MSSRCGFSCLPGIDMGTNHRMFRLFAAVVVAVAATATVATADAQDDPEDYGDAIHVVQPKPVLQQGRINVTPQLGMTINDPLYRGFKIGGKARFHITERFYLGGLFEWHDFGGVLGGPTQTYRDVEAETQATPDAPHLNWGVAGELGFAPMFGKFSIFNRGLIYYNVSVSLGGGTVESGSVATAAADTGPAATLGIGAQFFFNDWMGLDVEVRNVTYEGTIRGEGDVLSHSWTVGAGISLLFPRSFEYEEADTL